MTLHQGGMPFLSVCGWPRGGVVFELPKRQSGQKKEPATDLLTFNEPSYKLLYAATRQQGSTEVDDPY